MESKKDIFITAIGTDSGKTFISSVFVEALGYDYWKPIQSGDPRDTETVKALVSRTDVNYHPEAYLLNTPASPHASAKIDGVEIQLEKVVRPTGKRQLIIEGAGGMLVPLNDKDYVIDMVSRLDCEVVLVSNLYLGSINHTLLSIEYLKSKNIAVKGVIFNGPENSESQRIITHHSPFTVLMHIDQEEVVDQQMVRKYAELLKQKI